MNVGEQPFAARILTYLADRYLPVFSEWVETRTIARELGVDEENVNATCRLLRERALIELAEPEESGESLAAIITTPGLLAIGRVP